MNTDMISARETSQRVTFIHRSSFKSSQSKPMGVIVHVPLHEGIGVRWNGLRRDAVYRSRHKQGWGKRTRRKREAERELHACGAAVRLSRTLRVDRAARWAGERRVRASRSLCWVPPHTDVLPPSLEVKHTQMIRNTRKSLNSFNCFWILACD